MSTWPGCDQAASEGRVHGPGCCPHHRGLEPSVSQAERYGETVLKALLPPTEASEEWLSCERRVPSPGPSLPGSKPPPKPCQGLPFFPNRGQIWANAPPIRKTRLIDAPLSSLLCWFLSVSTVQSSFHEWFCWVFTKTIMERETGWRPRFRKAPWLPNSHSWSATQFGWRPQHHGQELRLPGSSCQPLMS